jgi:RNA polymerase sigma factor (sigma-70 family)
MHIHTQVLVADGLRAPSEAVLFKQAQAGCQACLEHLMTCHKRLVPFVVRRQTLGALSFSAAMQAGRIGLWRAIMGYDPQRGYAFSTYAYPAIARHVWQAVKRNERAQRSPPVMAAVQMIERTDPEVIWETTWVYTSLYHLVGRLPERLQRIIIARYGLAGNSPHSYREIGTTLGPTGERVRQLHTEALVWLRHPAHSQYLRALLGRHTLEDDAAAGEGRGDLRYGYRSLALQFAEPLRRFSFVLLDDFLPANAREENPAAALLLQLARFYPDLQVDVVAGDAGLGYYSFLHAAYQRGAKRVVDLRARYTLLRATPSTRHACTTPTF